MVISAVAAPANAYDYQAEFLQMAQWLTTQQNATSGGIWEGEDYTTVVETDNTAESIWIWSRYAEITGDYTTYLSNINKSWTYCLANPSWQEGGATAYYTTYNVGWGLLAEMKYRQVYGARPEYVNHTSYGTSCANHLVNNMPAMTNATEYLCVGIASGALYQYGVNVGNTAYQTRAVTLATSVRTWFNTTSNFSAQGWAVSAGVGVWGVLNSYYKANSGGATWAATAQTYMPASDTGTSDSYQNGHNAWYAWGHYAKIGRAHV